MTKTRLLVLATVPAFILCSCGHGNTKVEFKEFCDEVAKLSEKDIPNVDEVSVKGKLGDKSYSFVMNEEKSKEYTSEEVMVFMAIQMSSALTLYTMSENKDAEYFIGNGFKYKTADSEIQWDEHGLATKVLAESDGGKLDFTLSYSFK